MNSNGSLVSTQRHESSKPTRSFSDVRSFGRHQSRAYFNSIQAPTLFRTSVLCGSDTSFGASVSNVPSLVIPCFDFLPRSNLSVFRILEERTHLQQPPDLGPSRLHSCLQLLQTSISSSLSATSLQPQDFVTINIFFYFHYFISAFEFCPKTLTHEQY